MRYIKTHTRRGKAKGSVAALLAYPLWGLLDPISLNISDKINYVEFPAKDIEATKFFFVEVFGWSFEDYGPEHAAFSDQGIDGGFYQSDLASSAEAGGALVVPRLGV